MQIKERRKKMQYVYETITTGNLGDSNCYNIYTNMSLDVLPLPHWKYV